MIKYSNLSCDGKPHTNGGTIYDVEFFPGMAKPNCPTPDPSEPSIPDSISADKVIFNQKIETGYTIGAIEHPGKGKMEIIDEGTSLQQLIKDLTLPDKEPSIVLPEVKVNASLAEVEFFPSSTQTSRIYNGKLTLILQKPYFSYGIIKGEDWYPREQPKFSLELSTQIASDLGSVEEQFKEEWTAPLLIRDQDFLLNDQGEWEYSYEFSFGKNFNIINWKIQPYLDGEAAKGDGTPSDSNIDLREKSDKCEVKATQIQCIAYCYYDASNTNPSIDDILLSSQLLIGSNEALPQNKKSITIPEKTHRIIILCKQYLNIQLPMIYDLYWNFNLPMQEGAIIQTDIDGEGDTSTLVTYYELGEEKFNLYSYPCYSPQKAEVEILFR